MCWRARLTVMLDEVEGDDDEEADDVEDEEEVSE